MAKFVPCADNQSWWSKSDPVGTGFEHMRSHREPWGAGLQLLKKTRRCENAAQLYGAIPAFGSNQGHGMTNTDSSGVAVESIRAYKENCLCYRGQSWTWPGLSKEPRRLWVDPDFWYWDILTVGIWFLFRSDGDCALAFPSWSKNGFNIFKIGAQNWEILNLRDCIF